jgi:hypothetical protein
MSLSDFLLQDVTGGTDWLFQVPFAEVPTAELRDARQCLTHTRSTIWGWSCPNAEIALGEHG